MSNTAIVPAEKVNAIRAYLETDAVMTQLGKALPRGLEPKRLVRQAMTLVQKDPKLLECTQVSILVGIMAAAELGLELTGPLGHAFLVPRWNSRKKCNEATLQVGWKGLVALAYRSPSLGSLTARTAHANDRFDYALGTEHRIDHKPAAGDRGEATHYYAVAFFPSGEKDFEVWSKAEVVAHRMKYSPPKGNADYSAWATAFDAMARKTALRARCSRLSLCPEAQHAAAVDEYAEAGVEENRHAHREGGRKQELLDHLDAAGQQEAGVAQDAEFEPAAPAE